MSERYPSLSSTLMVQYMSSLDTFGLSLLSGEVLMVE